MALVPGVTATITPTVVLAFLPGRTAGLVTTEPNHYFSAFLVPETVDHQVQDDTNAGGAAGAPAAAGTSVPAEVSSPGLNTGNEWFERMHIFPGSDEDNPRREQSHQVDFGEVLAQEDEPYEVFNAHRRSSSTLSTLDASAVIPGIETPEVTASDVVGPLASLLAAASTQNTDGTTGLGVPVRTLVRALAAGLPQFAGDVVFTWSPGNVVLLPVAGDRVALVTAEYELPVEEVMGFATDVIDAKDGGEQRISVRKQPREGWACRFSLTGAARQRMQHLLLDQTASRLGLPLWHEQVRLASAVSPGGTTYPTSGAADVDFRVGGLAAVFALQPDGEVNPHEFDVLNLTAVSDILLTAASGSQYGYTAGSLLVPVRQVRVAGTPGGRRYPVVLEEQAIEFEAVENDAGAPAGSTAWNPATYNGRPLLDECNVMSGTTPEQLDRRIFVVDNSTGVVTQSSPWDRGKRSSQKGFSARTRAQVRQLKAILRYLRGRQRAFYLPTFAEDLTVAATLSIGTSTVDVVHVSYARFARQRDPKRVFRITFTDGTSLVRAVTASEATSTTVERLTLDATWPTTRAPSEVRRVQFYELVRFDADEFHITYPRLGAAQLEAPVRVLFDDD